MARDYATGLYTHCSESPIEPPEFEQRYGKRPMFALDELGFFTAPKAMIAHGVWLDPRGDRPAGRARRRASRTTRCPT